MNIRIGLVLFAVATLHAADPVTFSETIAPILYENCVTCHRAGEAAPFPLITYDDARKRGALLATVTQSRYMPPWHAEHGYGEFSGERHLTDAQIAAIQTWVKGGMPEGDARKLPKLPEFTGGWHLGKPDLVLEMTAAYEVPASGPDIYRNFSIPTGLKENKWVRAVEYRPSARKAVHHAILAYIRGGGAKDIDGRDGRPGFSGMNGLGLGLGAQANLAPSGSLGLWAVGNTPSFLPENQALPLAANTDVIIQLHFHPTGKAETEKSLVGIYFGEKPPERKIITLSLPSLFGIGKSVDIAAGAKDYRIQESTVLPADVRAFSIAAHAHYLGKEFKATATLPDGKVEPLLWIKDWDFNWQEQYNFRQPLLLPKGTRVDVSVTYDNSSENPHNPTNPPKRVLWGEQSFDEMGGVGLQVVAIRPEDEGVLTNHEAAGTRTAIGKGLQDGTVKRFLEQQARARAVTAVRLQQITLLDRQGKPVKTVGEPGIFSQAALSPDATKVAVIQSDRQNGNADVWVYNIATGKGTQITSDSIVDSSPVWSPDGRQIAYASSITDGNYNVINRKASDGGTGTAQLIYRHPPGDGSLITDWSTDGMLCFWSGELTYGLAVDQPEPRKPVKLARGRGGRFSPDGRWLAYNSNESGRFEIYAITVKQDSDTKPIRLTSTGGIGGITWRKDGAELHFLAAPGQAMMAVDMQPGNTLQAGTPHQLFPAPIPTMAPAQLSNVSNADGSLFVYLITGGTNAEK